MEEKERKKNIYHLSHSGSLTMEIGQIATWQNWGKKLRNEFIRRKTEMKAWQKNFGKEYSSSKYYYMFLIDYYCFSVFIH